MQRIKIEKGWKGGVSKVVQQEGPEPHAHKVIYLDRWSEHMLLQLFLLLGRPYDFVAVSALKICVGINFDNYSSDLISWEGLGRDLGCLWCVFWTVGRYLMSKWIRMCQRICSHVSCRDRETGRDRDGRRDQDRNRDTYIERDRVQQEGWYVFWPIKRNSRI